MKEANDSLKCVPESSIKSSVTHKKRKIKILLPKTPQYCRSNHKSRKSILIEFGFFKLIIITTAFLSSFKISGQKPLLSEIKTGKSIPSEN